MNHEVFDYWKTQFFRPDGVYYQWFIRHRKSRNGAHFHGRVSKFDQERSYSDANRHGFWPMGLEVHSVEKQYNFQSPVANCQVTGGDCYCYGTVLVAQERLGDVNPDGRDDQWIWNVLHSFYASHFSPTLEETNDPTS
jgi:hypothetical protein